MSGHSDKLTDGFFREILSIMTDNETYAWSEIFDDVKIVDKSAKNETIDLNQIKRFPTITCRSIGGTLTGAVEIGNGGILYCDDLIEDLEESLNPIRLQAKYDAYLNQFLHWTRTTIAISYMISILGSTIRITMTCANRSTRRRGGRNTWVLRTFAKGCYSPNRTCGITMACFRMVSRTESWRLAIPHGAAAIA